MQGMSETAGETVSHRIHRAVADGAALAGGRASLDAAVSSAREASHV